MSRARLALAWALLAFLAAVGLGRPLWTPDEPREAEISREMYRDPGVLPTLNGEPFYEKPPLYYWTVAAVFALAGGPDVAAARGVSAAAGLATLLVLFLWARRAASTSAAVTAVLLLGTSVQFLMSTHWVLIDPLLMLWTTLAAWAGWEVIRRPEAAGGFRALLYGALVLALWTKGLVGPVLLAAGLALYALLERRARPWRPLWPFRGAAVLAASVAALAAAIYAAGGRRALWAWGWQNHVQRFLDPHGTGHREPITYYAGPLLVAALPWLVPFLALFGRRFWRTVTGDPRLRRYCGALVAGGLLLLTLSATKRETYLLPLLPPLFLLMALAVEDRFAAADRGEAPSAWARLGERAQAALAALVAFLPAAAVTAYTGRLSPAAVASFTVAAAAAAELLASTWRRRLHRAAAAAVAAAAVFAASALVLSPPVLAGSKDFRPFLHWLDGRLPPGEPVAVLGADETVLGIVPFTTGRRVLEVGEEDLDRAAGARPRQLLVQVKGRGRPTPALPPDYQLVRELSFGPGRRLSLWNLPRTDRSTGEP